MKINVRHKGQSGEREVAKILNDVVDDVRHQMGLPKHSTKNKPFQRNQNQSAVGGADLTNPFSLEIEVKRQENLSVERWWRQTLCAADRSGGIPILMFRQNNKSWRIMMHGDIPCHSPDLIAFRFLGPVRVEINLQTFKTWFDLYYKAWLKKDKS